MKNLYTRHCWCFTFTAGWSNLMKVWLFHRPVKTSALRAQHIPPPRVGDFIRTFPFNTATLRASRSDRLELKIIIQELHKLTGQVAASDTASWRRKEGEAVKRRKDGEEDFEARLWGPKDPPLLPTHWSGAATFLDLLGNIKVLVLIL